MKVSQILLISILNLVSLTMFGCSNINPAKTQQTPPINKWGIALSCQDHSGKYLPVKVIQSRTSYLEKASTYQPIKQADGIIANDFTKDGKVDFIFIEKQRKLLENTGRITPNKFRLVICESRTDSYLRITPAFTVYESDLPDFQAGWQSIQIKNDDLILENSYHEHNWGGDRTTNSYQYDAHLKDFAIVKQEITSNSGDGYRSDRYESYDLRKQRYEKIIKCGEFEEGCQSSTSRGKLVPVYSKTKATLYRTGFKVGKIYQSLIPDKL